MEIDGTGFVLAATPAPVNGIVPVPPASVAVWFGSVRALAVFVLSTTQVYAVSPPQDPTADANGRLTLPTTVAVTLANVDAFGNVIAGESATSAAAFTYQLPELTGEENESDLARLVRTWLQLVKTQVTPFVSWPKNTDFDQATGDFLSTVDLPQLPGLVVSDVSLRTNDFYSIRSQVTVDNGDGTFTTREPPDTVDVVLTVVGISNEPTELLNLAAAFRRFMRKNFNLYMLRDPANPSLGSVKYEHNWHEGRDMRVTAVANASNLAHFAYEVSILGFDIEDMPGLPLGGPGDPGRQHEATVEVTNEAETIEILPSLRREPG